MKHNAKPMPRAAREIGQTAVLKTRRVAPKISGDFASSVMGKYLGTENYRNFFVRMIFHMMPEEAKEKGKTEIVHHTHIYNRYLRVYKTVKSAPVYRILTAVRKETVKEQKETQLLRKETERQLAQLQPLRTIVRDEQKEAGTAQASPEQEVPDKRTQREERPAAAEEGRIRREEPSPAEIQPAFGQAGESAFRPGSGTAAENVRTGSENTAGIGEGETGDNAPTGQTGGPGENTQIGQTGGPGGNTRAGQTDETGTGRRLARMGAPEEEPGVRYDRLDRMQADDADVIGELSSGPREGNLADMIAQKQGGYSARELTDADIHYDSDPDMVYHVLPDGTIASADGERSASRDASAEDAAAASPAGGQTQAAAQLQTLQEAMESAAQMQTGITTVHGGSEDMALPRFASGSGSPSQTAEERASQAARRETDRDRRLTDGERNATAGSPMEHALSGARKDGEQSASGDNPAETDRGRRLTEGERSASQDASAEDAAAASPAGGQTQAPGAGIGDTEVIGELTSARLPFEGEEADSSSAMRYYDSDTRLNYRMQADGMRASAEGQPDDGSRRVAMEINPSVRQAATQMQALQEATESAAQLQTDRTAVHGISEDIASPRFASESGSSSQTGEDRASQVPWGETGRDRRLTEGERNATAGSSMEHALSGARKDGEQSASGDNPAETDRDRWQADGETSASRDASAEDASASSEAASPAGGQTPSLDAGIGDTEVIGELTSARFPFEGEEADRSSAVRYYDNDTRLNYRMQADGTWAPAERQPDDGSRAVTTEINASTRQAAAQMQMLQEAMESAAQMQTDRTTVHGGSEDRTSPQSMSESGSSSQTGEDRASQVPWGETGRDRRLTEGERNATAGSPMEHTLSGARKDGEQSATGDNPAETDRGRRQTEGERSASQDASTEDAAAASPAGGQMPPPDAGIGDTEVIGELTSARLPFEGEEADSSSAMRYYDSDTRLNYRMQTDGTWASAEGQPDDGSRNVAMEINPYTRQAAAQLQVLQEAMESAAQLLTGRTTVHGASEDMTSLQFASESGSSSQTGEDRASQAARGETDRHRWLTEGERNATAGSPMEHTLSGARKDGEQSATGDNPAETDRGRRLAEGERSASRDASTEDAAASAEAASPAGVQTQAPGAGIGDTEVIGELTSARLPFEGEEADSSSAMRYYDSDTRLNYRMQADGAWSGAEGQPDRGGRSAAMEINPSASAGYPMVHTLSGAHKDGEQSASRDASTDYAAAASLPSRQMLAADTGIGDTEVIGRLTSARLPFEGEEADSSSAMHFYNSNTRLNYRMPSDERRTGAERTTDRRMLSKLRKGAYTEGSRDGAASQKAYHGIMTYLRGANDVRTIYRNILTILREGEPARPKYRNIMAYLRGDAQQAPFYDIVQQTQDAGDAGTQLAEHFHITLDDRIMEHYRNPGVDMLQNGQGTAAARLRMLQRHFFIRQTRDIQRIFETADSDAGRDSLRAMIYSDAAAELQPAQEEEQEERLIQRRREIDRVIEQEDTIRKLESRLSEIEDRQETETSEYEDAARMIRHLQNELTVQKENIVRLEEENHRLSEDLKIQGKEKRDTRLEELFDNSGQLDRQRYGMSRLY